MLRETASSKRIVVWNALGSGVYALSSFLLLIIVTRLCGEVEAGVFSIGYAIAQLMLTVGVFESTTFFATDAEEKFSYEQFLAFKLLTCAAMVVASIVYTASFGYDAHKAGVAYALCAYRLIEAFAQFYYSSFQRLERLDVAGLSTVWRSVLSMAAFFAILMANGDVVAGMIAATAVEVAWEVVYDLPRLNKIRKVGLPDFNRHALAALFIACLPLFISSFLSTYLSNVCKYAIDAVGSEEMQTVFNILFMPSFVINLFMIFFIRPTLTKMAKLWLHRDVKPLLGILAKLLMLTIATTCAVCVACWLVGIPILELLYGVPLDECAPALVLIMVGGGFLTMSNVLYNGMVVIRAQRGVMIGYVVAIIVANAAANPLIRAYGIDGAAIAYIVAGASVMLSFAVIFGVAFKMKLHS
jgi:O-antigen/teichoic acid export membrane protein